MQGESDTPGGMPLTEPVLMLFPQITVAPLPTFKQPSVHKRQSVLRAQALHCWNTRTVDSY